MLATHQPFVCKVAGGGRVWRQGCTAQATPSQASQPHHSIHRSPPVQGDLVGAGHAGRAEEQQGNGCAHGGGRLRCWRGGGLGWAGGCASGLINASVSELVDWQGGGRYLCPSWGRRPLRVQPPPGSAPPRCRGWGVLAGTRSPGGAGSRVQAASASLQVGAPPPLPPTPAGRRRCGGTGGRQRLRRRLPWHLHLKSV